MLYKINLLLSKINSCRTFGQRTQEIQLSSKTDFKLNLNMPQYSLERNKNTVTKIKTEAAPSIILYQSQSLLPLRPLFLRVLSEGIGVTSSMWPIFIPDRAKARRAAWEPGPEVLVSFPPVARRLMWRAVMPNSLHLVATSCAASIAAYGDDSSLSALTFIPPVIRTSVSLPDKSVTWMKVSLNEAKIRATPKTCSPSLTAGPRVTVSSLGSPTFLFDDIVEAVAVGFLLQSAGVNLLLSNKVSNFTH